MKTIGVIGWKNSGKTTLVSKLVKYFSSLKILNLKQNRGHARCIAFGLRYIYRN